MRRLKSLQVPTIGLEHVSTTSSLFMSMKVMITLGDVYRRHRDEEDTLDDVIFFCKY